MSAPLTRAQVRTAAVSAAYEVDSIASVILRLAPELASGPILDEELARTFGLRLRALAGVLMETVDQGDQTPKGDQFKDAVVTVFGELPADEEGQA